MIIVLTYGYYNTMEQSEIKNVGVKSFILYPTLTSSINLMDNTYHPKLTLGAMSGDTDLKQYMDYNIENRTRVLLEMDNLLLKDFNDVSFEQVAEHFSSKTKKTVDVNENIIQLTSLFANHRSKQAEKIKLKMSPSLKPMPMPGAGKPDEDIKKKKLLTLNPFKIPNPI
jgi:hypothetical protein